MNLQRWKDCGAVFAEDFGYPNNALSYTNIIPTYVDSPWGKALNIGTTAGRRIVHLVEKNFTAKTVMVRFYNDTVINASSTTQALVRFDTTTINNSSCALYLGSSTSLLTNEIITFNGYSSARSAWTSATGSIAIGWHTIVCTYNASSQWDIYLDGTLVSNTHSGAEKYAGEMQTLNQVFIGSNVYNSGSSLTYNSPFIGKFKEVICLPYTLTSTEISNYFNNGTFDYEKNIVSRWNLDSTTRVKDIGWRNGGYDGTVAGTSSVVETQYGKGLTFVSGTSVTTTKVWSEPIQTGVFSIVFTAKRTTSSATERLIWNTSATTGFVVQFLSSDRFQVMLRNAGAIILNEAVNLDTDTTKTNWYAITGDGTNCYVYMNGILQGTYAFTTSNFGGTPGSTTFGYSIISFIGTMSKVAIFDKCLTKSDQFDINERMTRGEL